MIPWFAQWLVSGTVVAVIATVAIRLVPAGAAAERHRLWWATLLAVLALPVLAQVSLGPTAPGAAMAPQEAMVAEPAGLVGLNVPTWATLLMPCLWAVWSAVAIARLGCGAVAIRRLLRSSRPLALPSWRLPGVRGARVVCSPELAGACVVGFFKPTIVVSSELVKRLERDALDAIVRHEAAHLERYDDWTHLAAQVIVAVVGAHPAVWWIARQIERECEAACDAMVAADTGDPHGYASALAAVAEASLGASRERTMLAPGALMRRSSLTQRVMRVLAHAPIRSSVRWGSALATLGVVSGATVAALSLPPVLVPAGQRVKAGLASLPQPRAVRAAVPTIDSRRLDVPAEVNVLRAADQTRVAEVTALPPVQDAPPEPANAPLPAPGEDAAPPADDALVVAPARNLAFVVPTPADAIAAEGQGFGALAARAGGATGSAMNRAGRSVGRFFGNSGRAIANRF